MHPLMSVLLFSGVGVLLSAAAATAMHLVLRRSERKAPKEPKV